MDFEERADFMPIDEPIKKPKSRHLRVHAVTWNVNSKAPPKDLLAQLFVYSSDIYVIGLQEMGSHDWPIAIDPVLSTEGLVRIKTRKLQGIMIIVYVQRYLLDYITSIESESTKTGLGGMWGNKGAVSVRFEIYGVSVIFVNSHLAAHDDQVSQRVKDVSDIIDNQKFKDPDVNCILDHDYVFWMGDMNFRVEMSYESALALVAKSDIPALLAHDQLSAVMKEKLIFQDFKEAPIRFLPTYKFDVGTDIYDTSQKRRVPSYTDRLVYHFHNAQYGMKSHLNVDISGYRCHPSFKDSDHKPVSCTMDFLGLSKPQPNPVTFKINRVISRKHPMHINYGSHKFELTTGDWIGVFPVDFCRLLTDFIHYQYASVNYTNHPYSGHIQIAVNNLTSLVPGFTYVLCYFSKKHCLSGMSKTFKIKD